MIDFAEHQEQDDATAHQKAQRSHRSLV